MEVSLSKNSSLLMPQQTDPDNESDNEKLVYIVKEKINDKKNSRIKKIKSNSKSKDLNIEASLELKNSKGIVSIEPVIDKPIKKDNKIIIKDDFNSETKSNDKVISINEVNSNNSKGIVSSVPEVELKPIIDNQSVIEQFPCQGNSSFSKEKLPIVEAPIAKKKRVLTDKQKEHLKKIQALSKKSRDKKKKETIEDSTINKLKDVINTEVINVIKPVMDKVNKFNDEEKKAPKNDTFEPPKPVVVEPPKVVYVEPPKPISRYEQNMNMVYQRFKKVEPVKKTSFIELMRQSQFS
jgi:hypothetical protein